MCCWHKAARESTTPSKGKQRGHLQGPSLSLPALPPLSTQAFLWTLMGFLLWTSSKTTNPCPLSFQKSLTVDSHKVQPNASMTGVTGGALEARKPFHYLKNWTRTHLLILFPSVATGIQNRAKNNISQKQGTPLWTQHTSQLGRVSEASSSSIPR